MRMPADNDKQALFRQYKFCVGAWMAACMGCVARGWGRCCLHGRGLCCQKAYWPPSQPAPCCPAPPAAMENSISEDYVTEKVWDALVAGCVPIYYGREWASNRRQQAAMDRPRKSGFDCAVARAVASGHACFHRPVPGVP
jgi:hypothetical protein